MTSIHTQISRSTTIKILGACLTSLWLSACGGASDKIDDSLDKLEKNRHAGITFINALDEMAAFYIKPKSISHSVFTEQYQAVEILSGEVSSPYSYQWHQSLEETKFGVRDSNSQSKSTTLKKEVNQDGNYWLLAWQDEDEYQLSLFAKSQQNNNNYSVRIFANQAFPIYLNGEPSPVTVTEKGQVSASYQINDCASGLVIGLYPVDFCQQANLGQSYLVVIDEQGNIITGQE